MKKVIIGTVLAAYVVGSANQAAAEEQAKKAKPKGSLSFNALVNPDKGNLIRILGAFNPSDSYKMILRHDIKGDEEDPFEAKSHYTNLMNELDISKLLKMPANNKLGIMAMVESGSKFDDYVRLGLSYTRTGKNGFSHLRVLPLRLGPIDELRACNFSKLNIGKGFSLESLAIYKHNYDDHSNFFYYEFQPTVKLGKHEFGAQLVYKTNFKDKRRDITPFFVYRYKF